MEGITDRDIKLFRTLDAFGMLSTRQIQGLLFPNVSHTTLCRRLRTLESRHLLHRVRGLPDGGQVWGLSLKCARDLGFERPMLHVNRNSLEHDICLADVRMALTKAGVGHQWVAEHELRRTAWKEHYEKRTSVEGIPDALITVKYQGEFRVIAMELELRMKSVERYQKIFQKHGDRRSLWMLWYLVPTVSMGKRLEALWLEQPSYYRRCGFIWSLVPDVLTKINEAKIYQEDREHLLTQVLTH